MLLAPFQALILSSVLGSSKLSLALCPETKAPKKAHTGILFTPVDGIMDLPRAWPDLRNGISPGMRTFTLSLKDTHGLSAQTRPGDRVDVIFACASSRYTPEGGDEQGARVTRTDTKKHARIIVQNSRVLYTEKDSRPDPADQSPVSRVVLELSPEDAEKLAVIRDTDSKSRLRLVLRHPDDHAVYAGKGCDLFDFLNSRKKTARVAVIRDNKTRIRSFYAEP